MIISFIFLDIQTVFSSMVSRRSRHGNPGWSMRSGASSGAIPLGVNVSHNAPLLARRLIPCQKNWARSLDRLMRGTDSGANSSSDKQSYFHSGWNGTFFSYFHLPFLIYGAWLPQNSGWSIKGGKRRVGEKEVELVKTGKGC